ncbi:MAG: hypothetical protein WED10_06460 [Brumimicrobium sp.]
MENNELLNKFKEKIEELGKENYCSNSTDIRYNLIDNVNEALAFYGEKHLTKGFMNYLKSPEVGGHITVFSYYFMISDYLDATYFPIIERYAGPITLIETSPNHYAIRH